MNAQPHKPSWFTDGNILVINAPTCGINKDGAVQYKVATDGTRSSDIIDDKLSVTVKKLMNGDTQNIRYAEFVPDKKIINSQVWVPQYHDQSAFSQLEEIFGKSDLFEIFTIRELLDKGKLSIMKGHGSPSSDQRIGEIPYIKVSDIRAGQININPTNRIPIELAERFWRGEESGLKAYDLISPERASKNIGEFSVLMPGQENIVLTKEVIIIRSNVVETEFDQFYLIWALSLLVVREQWKRCILMQTNREDIGERYLEIELPIPRNKKISDTVSKYFKDYFESQTAARIKLQKALETDQYKHSFYLT